MTSWRDAGFGVAVRAIHAPHASGAGVVLRSRSQDRRPHFFFTQYQRSDRVLVFTDFLRFLGSMRRQFKRSV